MTYISQDCDEHGLTNPAIMASGEQLTEHKAGFSPAMTPDFVSPAKAPSSSKPESRPSCPRCLRPLQTCICDALVADLPLATQTRIAILVHPKEVQLALGTLPLLKLCLKDLIVHVGDRFPEPDEDPRLHETLHADGFQCQLVCPGPDAEELCHDEDRDGTDGIRRALIFIDGRWSQAKSMINRSEWLRQLPRVVLRPRSQSGYVFRKQPQEGCLSTLEAVAEALEVLEGPSGQNIKAALIAPFHEMVKYQCKFLPEIEDKNARLVAPPEPLPIFDPEKATGKDGQKQVHCIVHWGEKTVGQRDVIVTEVMYDGQEAAKHRATELSAGRSHGKRFWALPIHKIPSGALFDGA